MCVKGSAASLTWMPKAGCTCMEGLNQTCTWFVVSDVSHMSTWRNHVNDVCTGTKSLHHESSKCARDFEMCATTHRNMIHLYVMTYVQMWQDLLMYVTWLLIFVTWRSIMTHVHVYHDSGTCAPWLIYMCAMTHEYVSATAYSYVPFWFGDESYTDDLCSVDANRVRQVL